MTVGGSNFGGQLENLSGTNAVTGIVTTNADAAIGATAGILNINGGVTNPTTTAQAHSFTGAGTINVNSNLTSATATGFQLFAGTTNLSGGGTITGGSR